MNTPKKILFVAYTQTGQLGKIADNFLAPLEASNDVTLDRIELAPCKPYPFPWPFLSFFDHFPETVYEEPKPIELNELNKLDDDYDLVILGYQVWFLSPSQPMTAFLQSDAAKKLLNNTPVITLIGCRNMWLMAQERMKAQLNALGAKHIDNVVLTDDAHSAATFISTPVWMLTGNKGPLLNGLIPQAGVPEPDIKACSRFGQSIVDHAKDKNFATQSLMRGLRAVSINERLIASEKVATRSFKIWGGLLRLVGKQGAPQRRLVLVFYIVFLVSLILTVVPISAMIKRLLSPLTQKTINQQKAYYAQPSGE